MSFDATLPRYPKVVSQQGQQVLASASTYLLNEHFRPFCSPSGFADALRRNEEEIVIDETDVAMLANCICRLQPASFLAVARLAWLQTRLCVASEDIAKY
jgi:hypothetical protein